MVDGGHAQGGVPTSRRPAGPLGDRFEIHAYRLPDGGRLQTWLQDARQQFREDEWIIARIREALSAWEKLAGNSLLILAREVIGATVADEEVRSCTEIMPNWLADMRRDAF
jgi:hypothetical protein